MKISTISLLLTGVLTLTGGTSLAAQAESAVMVTDSVTGTLVQRLPNGFILRTDEGDEIALEVASDTIQELRELEPDTILSPTPHHSVMPEDDVLFVLKQLEESEDRDRMHVHYITLADPGRRVVVWLSIAADRVPGTGR